MNEPTATIEPTGQLEPVKTEPLLFKLGDDYQIRKAKFNEELKAWDILAFTYSHRSNKVTLILVTLRRIKVIGKCNVSVFQNMESNVWLRILPHGGKIDNLATVTNIKFKQFR